MTLAVTGAIVLRRNVRGKPIGCGLLGVLVAGEMACAEGVYTQFAPSVQGQMYPASTVSRLGAQAPVPRWHMQEKCLVASSGLGE